MNKDPTADIYKTLDKAGLGITKFSQARALSKIISEIRTIIATEMRDYITARDKTSFEAGRQKGLQDAEEKRIKTIEVQNG